MELRGLRNDTYFLSGMSRNFTDYATMPLLTSGMLRNFIDCLMMGVKYLEVVKQRLHATKQCSPDEIRV